MENDFLKNVLEEVHEGLQSINGVERGTDSFEYTSKLLGNYFLEKFLQTTHIKREITYWKNHKNTDCEGWSLSYYLKGESINSKSYNACLLDLAIDFLGEEKVDKIIEQNAV